MESHLPALERLWHCIKRRLNETLAWSEVPVSVAATEYLSLLRLALAPARLEGCLYEGEQFLAATLPVSYAEKTHSGTAAPITPPYESFFHGGPRAVEEWCRQMERSGDMESAGVARLYAEHFAKVGQHKAQRSLGGTRDCHLVMYSDSPALTETLDTYLKAFPFCDLLDAADASTAQSQSTGLIRRKLAERSVAGDRLFHRNLENFEEELAILISGEVRDIWLLFPPPTDRSRLSFYTERRKRERILGYFRPNEHGGTVGDLIQKVLNGSQMSRDDFLRLLTPCLTKVHSRSGLRWDDDAPLTPAHIECLNEKFREWPTKVGIVSTLLATGCLEVVPEFEEDYRVRIYRHLLGTNGADEETQRLLLAEKVFINLRPHLVEVPLLWTMTPQGGCEYIGVLLALFDSSQGANADRAAKEIQQRALEVRLEVERWYSRLRDYIDHHRQTRNTLGYFVHEVRNTLAQYRSRLTWDDGAALDEKLEAVFTSHRFLLADDGEPSLDQVTVLDLETLITKSCEQAKGKGPRKGEFKVICDGTLEGQAGRGYVSVHKLLFTYHLTKFLEESLQQVGNLQESATGNDDYEVRVCLRAEGNYHLTVTICHRIGAAKAEYIEQNRNRMGFEELRIDDDPRPRRGLYFFGEFLRHLQGEFCSPTLDAEGDRVTWKLRLPFKRT